MENFHRPLEIEIGAQIIQKYVKRWIENYRAAQNMNAERTMRSHSNPTSLTNTPMQTQERASRAKSDLSPHIHSMIRSTENFEVKETDNRLGIQNTNTEIENNVEESNENTGEQAESVITNQLDQAPVESLGPLQGQMESGNRDLDQMSDGPHNSTPMRSKSPSLSPSHAFGHSNIISQQLELSPQDPQMPVQIEMHDFRQSPTRDDGSVEISTPMTNIYPSMLQKRVSWSLPESNDADLQSVINAHVASEYSSISRDLQNDAQSDSLNSREDLEDLCVDVDQHKAEDEQEETGPSVDVLSLVAPSYYRHIYSKTGSNELDRTDQANQPALDQNLNKQNARSSKKWFSSKKR